MPSLENKAVFRLKKYSYPQKLNDTYMDVSRGGGRYIGDFCFAVLDWGNDNQAHRQVAIDRNIIEPEQRLTQRVLTDYFNNNPGEEELFNAAVAALAGGGGQNG